MPSAGVNGEERLARRSTSFGKGHCCAKHNRFHCNFPRAARLNIIDACSSVLSVASNFARPSIFSVTLLVRSPSSFSPFPVPSHLRSDTHPVFNPLSAIIDTLNHFPTTCEY